MEIRLGNLLIKSDSYQYIIQEEKTYQKDTTNSKGEIVNKAGAKYYGEASYYSNFSSVLQGLLERRLKTCEATKIVELTREVEKFRLDIQPIIDVFKTINRSK